MVVVVVAVVAGGIILVSISIRNSRSLAVVVDVVFDVVVVHPDADGSSHFPRQG